MNCQRTINPVAVVQEINERHRIFVFGGWDYIEDQMGDLCEYLDIGTTAWVPVKAQMHTQRCDYTAILVNQSTVIFCGGRYFPYGTNTCESFDLESHVFSSLPGMSIARFHHTCILYRGSVVIIGGFNNKQPLNSCEQLDKDQTKWMGFPSLNAPHYGANALVIDDRIIAVNDHMSVEVFDGVAWSVIHRMPMGLQCASMVPFNDVFILLGGTRDECCMFNPTTMKLSLFPSMLTGRSFCAAISF